MYANHDGHDHQRRLDGHMAIKCKACGFRTQAADADPDTGKYLVELAWGRNAIAGAINEVDISGYTVAIVDKYGRNAQVLKRMATLAVQQNACCNQLEYHTTVSGTWPTSIDINNGYFAVMPYQTVQVTTTVNGNTVVTPTHVDLPVATAIFDRFVDKVPEAGKVVNKVLQTVSATVEGADANTRCANAKAFEESTEAKNILAKSYSASTGIPQSHVACRRVYTTGGGCAHSTTRRLTDANKPKINGEFEVIIPESFSGTFQQSTLDTATFQTSVQTLSQESVDPAIRTFTVSAVQAADPVITGVTVDTPTDGARPMVLLAISSIAVILALAGRPILSL
jgi:hypothetical protein